MATPTHTHIIACFLAVASQSEHQELYHGSNYWAKFINIQNNNGGSSSEVTESQFKRAMNKWQSQYGLPLSGQSNPEHNGLIVWEVPKKQVTMEDGKKAIRTSTVLLDTRAKRRMWMARH